MSKLSCSSSRELFFRPLLHLDLPGGWMHYDPLPSGCHSYPAPLPVGWFIQPHHQLAHQSSMIHLDLDPLPNDVRVIIILFQQADFYPFHHLALPGDWMHHDHLPSGCQNYPAPTLFCLIPNLIFLSVRYITILFQADVKSYTTHLPEECFCTLLNLAFPGDWIHHGHFPSGCQRSEKVYFHKF